MDYQEEKEMYLQMPVEEKRSLYSCKPNHITLDEIESWKKIASTIKFPQPASAYPKNEILNGKVSLFDGDITALEIDVIVNAANNSLRGSGGVHGAIHYAAGRSLLKECITLQGCPTGEAKITGGYKLPSKYIIHTAGPIGEVPDKLKNCYSNCLSIAKENELRSIAFPCISTGLYCYPKENAAHVALKTVREFLEKNGESIDRIIFCLFLTVDIGIYENLM